MRRSEIQHLINNIIYRANLVTWRWRASHCCLHAEKCLCILCQNWSNDENYIHHQRSWSLKYFELLSRFPDGNCIQSLFYFNSVVLLCKQCFVLLHLNSSLLLINRWIYCIVRELWCCNCWFWWQSIVFQLRLPDLFVLFTFESGRLQHETSFFELLLRLYGK